MKLALYMLLGIALILEVKAQDIQEVLKNANKASMPVFIIYNNQNQSNDGVTNVSTKSSSNPYTVVSATTTTSNWYNQVVPEIKKAVKAAKTKINSKIKGLQELVWLYKYHCALYVTLALYLYLCWHTYWAVAYLSKLPFWLSFKSDLSFEQLLQINQKELAHELMITFEMHYMDKHNPTDFFTPITRFVRDIEAEIAQLAFYESLFKLITSLHLEAITFAEQKYIAQFQQKKQRLLYLKNLCKQWVIEYYMKAQPKQPDATTC